MVLWTILVGIGVVVACFVAGNAVASIQGYLCPSQDNYYCPANYCVKAGKDYGHGPMPFDIRWFNEHRKACNSTGVCGDYCTLSEAGCQCFVYSTTDGTCGEGHDETGYNFFNVCTW
jgi:alpha-D-ribose 1-methylphosphonate 5-phosphate C-P lyase